MRRRRRVGLARMGRVPLVGRVVWGGGSAVQEVWGGRERGGRTCVCMWLALCQSQAAWWRAPAAGRSPVGGSCLAGGRRDGQRLRVGSRTRCLVQRILSYLTRGSKGIKTAVCSRTKGKSSL